MSARRGKATAKRAAPAVQSIYDGVELEDLISQLKDLKLSKIPNKSVNAMWTGEEDLSGAVLTDLVESLSPQLTADISTALSTQHAGNQEDGEEVDVLDRLASEKIDLKALVLVLRKIIETTGGRHGVLAARAYLQILAQKDASAYDLFNIFTVKSVLELTKRWVLAQAHRQSAKTGGEAKDGQAENGDGQEGEEEDKMDEDLNPAAAWTAENDARRAALLSVPLQDVFVLLSSIGQFCSSYSLQEAPETFGLTVQVASELSRFRVPISDATEEANEPAESDTPVRAKRAGRASKNKRPPAVGIQDEHIRIWTESYKIFEGLCSAVHGLAELNTTTVMKTLLPNLLLTFAGLHAGPSISKLLQSIRQRAVAFVKGLMQKPNVVFTPFQALLQHLCIKVPEKAEYRHNAVEAVCELLPAMNGDHQKRFVVSFLDKYAKNQKASFRLLAVDLALQLIQTSSFMTQENIDPAIIRTLLLVLIQRSSDKSVNVRSKALGNVATALTKAAEFEKDSELRRLIEAVFFAKARGPADASQPVTSVSLMVLLRRRIADEKASVRKSALVVLEMVGRLNLEGVEFADEEIRLLQQCCFDPQLAIRKQAVVSLSELLIAYPQSEVLIQTWTMCVPPLIFDTEQTIQEKVSHYFLRLAIEPLTNKANTQDALDFTFSLLEALDRPEYQKTVARICAQLARDKSIPRSLQKILVDILRTQQLKGAWFLLGQLAQFNAASIDAQFILQCWDQLKDINEAALDDHKVKVFKVLGQVVGQLEAQTVADLTVDLTKRVEEFTYRPALIQIFLQTLTALKSTPHDKGKKAAVANWIRPLLTQCDEALGDWILPHAGLNHASGANEQVADPNRIPPTIEMLDAYLFSVGELATKSTPAAIPKRLVTIIQTLAGPTGIKLNITVGKDGETKETQLPASTRAHAFIALGKLCLNDSQLAKTCMALFARELEMSSSSVVRNNVMVVLCDLAIRYTTLVDAYMGKIALCLRDDSEMVRRQALMMLTNLMQEGYLKLRQALFFRLARVLVDESPALRQYASMCVDAILNREGEAGKMMFYNKFVETIFFLNDYRSHPTYNQFAQNERERVLFSLAGSNEDNKKKRMELYKLFLQRMSEDQKFQLMGKLVHDILAGVVEGEISLESGREVLSDTLAEIKLKVTGIGVAKDAEDQDDSTEGARKLVEAKGKVLNKLVKKNLMENIVPIVVELKHMLSAQHSPLLKDLMDFLREMMKAYKDEIAEILVGDRQLARELEYDMRTAGTTKPATKATTTANSHLASADAPSAEQAPQSAKKVPKLKAAATPTSYVPSPAKRRTSMGGEGPAGAFAVPAAPTRKLSDVSSPSGNNATPRRLLASPALARVSHADITISTSPTAKQVVRRVSFAPDVLKRFELEDAENDKSQANKKANIVDVSDDEADEEVVSLSVQRRQAGAKRKRSAAPKASEPEEDAEEEEETEVQKPKPKRAKPNKEAANPRTRRNAKRKAM